MQKYVIFVSCEYSRPCEFYPSLTLHIIFRGRLVRWILNPGRTLETYAVYFGTLPLAFTQERQAHVLCKSASPALFFK